MEKRYQVFISSTFEDLKEERQAVLKSILELNHMPAGMELFPATDDVAWQLICDVIDASDYYVLIIGGRYGSLDEAGISFTEKEYDYAVLKKKPVISLIHANPDNLPRGKTEIDSAGWEKLKAFRKKIKANHTCKEWQTASDLKSEVIIGLTTAIKRNPTEGWIRAGAIASEEANREIIQLQKVVSKQKNEIDRLSSNPPAGSEKLAQGSDIYIFEGKFTLGSEDNISEKDIRDIELTWNEIFLAVAPILINPTPETKMKTAISRTARLKMEEPLKKDYPKHSISHLTINETIFQNMKVQLLALGLIDNTLLTRSTNGVEKDIPICKLTGLGKQTLIKLNAIYRE